LGILALIVASTPARALDPDAPVIPQAERKSGTALLSPAMQSRQDETVNPGMMWVDRGRELWSAPAGTSGKSCADCHGLPERMQGIASRYPAFDVPSGKLTSIETRIMTCRVEKQRAEPLKPESEDLLALESLVARQSTGRPINVSVDGSARHWFDIGKRLFHQRQGQLNLSCAQCHDQSWGKRLRTETISQGQPTGYPIYRLEWQTMGSLHRRLRSCAVGVRGQAPAFGSDEHLGLELYLAWRAQGLPIETPAVRR
jgi:sulfur-oxidizing protein SoxA